MEEYRIATSAEKQEAGVYDDYDLLIGPDGFQCALTEPEDRTFSRDLKPLVIELNRLRHLTNVKLKGTVSIKQDRINDLENALRDTLRQLEKAINGNAIVTGSLRNCMGVNAYILKNNCTCS